MNPLRFVSVEGPIGVGKTTLARRLAEALGGQTLLEQPDENPFLERFYQNPKQAALPTQLFFLFQRARQLDTVLRQFCQARANAHYAEIQYELTPTMLARDGYHPSEIACAQLARALAPQLLRQLKPRA